LANSPNQGAVAVVDTTYTKRVYSVFMASVVSDCLAVEVERSRGAAIWLAVMPNARLFTKSENCTMAFARVWTMALLSC